MNEHQFDIPYRTQSRLYSNQKTCRIIKNLHSLKKKKSLEKYNHWKHITISSDSPILILYIKQCLCGSHDQQQVQVPSTQCRREKTISYSWLNAIFFSCRLQYLRLSRFIGNTSWMGSEHSSRLQALFWCSKPGKPQPFGTPDTWKQTRGIISNS